MRYFIQTFGCQMNTADSERIAGYFESQGYKKVKTLAGADVFVINTCSVRQASEDRVYGLAGKVEDARKKHPLKVILTGCMVGSASKDRKRISANDLKKKVPWVDEFIPLGNFGFQLLPKRQDKKKALVPISSGCNHFCSYCVVPHARGEEKSRPFEEIVCEVEGLAKRGYREVLLLGQNVNTYGKDKSYSPPLSYESIRGFREPFPQLLERLSQITGLKKISFLTSHPKDMSVELIKALSLSKLEKYLHLPVQAGSDEVLRRMNRGYTASQYLSLLRRIRKVTPTIRIGTDVIVGFPGETEKQFAETVKLFRKAKFAVAYIAIYSPRPGTAAARMEDDVSISEKKRRYQVLAEVFEQCRN